jgi:hypothetical protein
MWLCLRVVCSLALLLLDGTYNCYREASEPGAMGSRREPRGTAALGDSTTLKTQTTAAQEG